MKQEGVYKSLEDYFGNNPVVTEFTAKKLQIDSLQCMKISCKYIFYSNVWAVKINDEIWIRNNTLYYKLREDSIGLFYDEYVDPNQNGSVAVGVVGGLDGVAIFMAIDVSGGFNFNLKNYRTYSYRLNPKNKEFELSEYPNMQWTKIYYYSLLSDKTQKQSKYCF